jgi:hypothetical protein
LAAISSGDIRSLLNIEAMAAVLQTSFSALAPWSGYFAARRSGWFRRNFLTAIATFPQLSFYFVAIIDHSLICS